MSVGLIGRLQGFGLAELLQVLAQSKKTGVLTLRGGSAEGSITLVNGRLVAVSADTAAGEEAVFALMRNTGGRFSFVSSSGDVTDDRSYETMRPLEVLLLDASVDVSLPGPDRPSEGRKPTRTGGR